MFLPNRIDNYNQLSSELAKLTDSELCTLLNSARTVHCGIGGNSLQVVFNQISIFVKRLPLSQLELEPQNIQSTANLYNLPPSCHYGIGSPGFVAWRELTAHNLSTQWVLMQQCSSFPILYHWRILPVEVLPFDTSFWTKEDYNPWKDSKAVSIRLRALGQPQAQVLLFLEYLPQSLYSWLNTKLKEDTDTASRSLRFVEENLMSVYNFTSKQNFIHFDAHFENIMTDGEQLYLSDFGLSLSTKFDLEKAEIEFFKTHQSTYDQSTMSIHLVHAVITSQYGKENWREVFKEHVDTNFVNLSEPYKSTVKKHAEVALSMDDFLRKQGISPDSVSYSSKL